MNVKYVYILLCVLGTLIPMSQFLPWLLENGFDPSMFLMELFSTKIGTFFGLDVIVSAVVLFIFIYVEGGKLKMKKLWIPVASTLLIGVSLGLPLFLAMRQQYISSTT